MTRILLSFALLLTGLFVHAQCVFDITVPADLTICSPEQIDLTANISGDPFFAVEWEGTNGFSSDDLSSNDTPTTNTSYTLTAFGATDINLVENGDFEDGNSGFTSSYLDGSTFCPQGPFNPFGPLACPGMFVISDNPNDTHTNFSSCGDHTSGSGQMMVVNGSPNSVNIWCQNISTTADNDYLFSAWATAVHPESPAILQFSINGSLIGENFALSGEVCSWENFTASWTAGASTSATICITNQNTNAGGNDFAIDDIEFLEVCKQESSFDVTLAVFDLDIDSLSCINPSGNIIISSNIDASDYNWIGPNGFTSTADTLSDLSAGTYIYTAVTPTGCTNSDSVVLTADFESPELTLTTDSITCANPFATIILETNTDFEIVNIVSNDVIEQYQDSIHIGAAGMTTITIQGSNGCTTTEVIQITENFSLAEFISIDDFSLSCNYADSLVTSLALGDETVNWFLDGIPFSNETAAEINTAGDYEIVYTNPFSGCTETDSVEVTADFQADDFFITGTSINCNNALAIIALNLSTQVVENIDFDLTLFQENEEAFSTLTAGTYDFVVTYENGCTAENSFTVDIDTISPTVSTVDVIMRCDNDYVEITASPSGGDYEFIWTGPNQFSSMDLTTLVSSAGEYNLVVIDAFNGCTASSTLTVSENQTEIQAEYTIFQPSCPGDLGSVEIEDPTGGTAPYMIYLLNSFLEPIEPTNLGLGTYYISIGDANGCGFGEAIEIIDAVPFSINLQDELTVDSGSNQSIDLTTDLNESEIGLIRWAPAEFLSCDNCIRPEIIDLTEDKWFFVEVQDQNGCTQFDSIFVRVQLEYSFYEANSFSPNEDGTNDIFYLQSDLLGSTCNVQEFSIYDRWGNQVFSDSNFPPNDPAHGWDGKVNERIGRQGVYSYFAIIELSDGTVLERKGSVTIIR
ncbi:gliding motility-associated C-terminal domain-containing protein [Saprospiraceae bacterium]|nr:gliding motility-associated C-terminal domain-containing protein [Saprospiraceae bacterium]